MENNNFNSNNRQPDFNNYNEIEIVENNAENKSNKLPIILMVCVLAIALITGVLLVVLKTKEASAPVVNQTTTQASDPLFEEFYSNALAEVITDESGSEISREEYITQVQQQIQDATTVLNQYVGSESPNNIEGSSEENTVNAETLGNTDTLIKAFFNKTFFLKGALYSGDSGDPIHMAMNGDDFEVLTNIDGTELSFLRIDGKMYIKRTATMQYIPLTTAFFKLLGIDPDTMTFDFGEVNYDSIKDSAVISNVTINKKPGICYSFKNNDQSFKFFFEEDDLKQIVIYNEDGSVASEFSIDYFSATIPDDQLTIEGYKKTGIGTIFADLM